MIITQRKNMGKIVITEEECVLRNGRGWKASQGERERNGRPMILAGNVNWKQGRALPGLCAGHPVTRDPTQPVP